MKQSDLKKAYDEIRVTKDMDREVLDFIKNGKTKKRKGEIIMKKGLAVAAALAIIVGSYQVPIVKVSANSLMQKIVYHFSGENADLNLEMNEKKEVKSAPVKEGKYNSISEIEEILKLDLLSSSKACTEGGYHISYEPIKNKDGEVIAVYISDHIYEIGDLHDVDIHTSSETDTNNRISYCKGEKYASPIEMQIAIKLKRNDGKEGNIGFSGGESSEFSKEKGYENSETYEMKNIGEKAFITTYGPEESVGLGPVAWNCEDADLSTLTMAIFTHNGIEYSFCGSVSVDTMKAFLDTLQ